MSRLAIAPCLLALVACSGADDGVAAGGAPTLDSEHPVHHYYFDEKGVHCTYGGVDELVMEPQNSEGPGSQPKFNVVVIGYGQRPPGTSDRYMVDDLNHTWGYKTPSEWPSDFKSTVTEALNSFFSSGWWNDDWTFPFQSTTDNNTDTVIVRDTIPPASGCDSGGQCWFGSGGCVAGLSFVATVGGLNYYKCNRFQANFNIEAMNEWATYWGASLINVYYATIRHEFGHTLGLNHTSQSGNYLMRSSVPITGIDYPSHAVLTQCAEERLGLYGPDSSNRIAILDNTNSPTVCTASNN